MFVLLARVHSWFVKLSHSSLEPPCKHGSGAHITSLTDVFHQVHQRGHLAMYSVETERTAEFEKKNSLFLKAEPQVNVTNASVTVTTQFK